MSPQLSPRVHCSRDKSLRLSKKINQSKTKSDSVEQVPSCVRSRVLLQGLYCSLRVKSLQQVLSLEQTGDLLQGLVLGTSPLVCTP